MKRIFIVGGSVLQLPAIQMAKEMGLYVGVADYNPDAVGISFADEFFQVSTIDEEGIYQAAKTFGADGIMTLATDMPMRSVAYAAQRLSLIGISYDTAIKATDKGEMIKAFEAAGVGHPWYFVLSTPSELETVGNQINFPCISKPVDNAGSRGVMLIQNRDNLNRAVKYSSSNGRKGGVIVEEYLQGKEVSVEIMVVDGVVYILQITDKLTTGAPHFVEMGHSEPSRLGEANIKAIKGLAVRAVKAIGIDNGPAHVEIMLTEDGPKMIEIGARMGGDNITTHLVPLSTGIDMVKAAIQVALGEKPDLKSRFKKGSAIRYFKEATGLIKDIIGVDTAKKINGIKDIIVVKNLNDEIENFESSVDRIGFVIAQADNAEEAVQYCERALEKIQVIVG